MVSEVNVKKNLINISRGGTSFNNLENMRDISHAVETTNSTVTPPLSTVQERELKKEWKEG